MFTIVKKSPFFDGRKAPAMKAAMEAAKAAKATKTASKRASADRAAAKALPQFVAAYETAAVGTAAKAARDAELTAELTAFVNSGCKTIVTKGSGCKLDLQLFASEDNTSDDDVKEVRRAKKVRKNDLHGHNSAIVDALKNHRGNMVVPVITPVADSNGFRCVISTASIPVSVITGEYAKDNLAMATSVIDRFMTVKKGSNDIVIVNMAGIANDANNRYTEFFTERPFYLRLNGKQKDGQAAIQLLVTMKNGNVMVTSGSNCGKAQYLEAKLHVDNDPDKDYRHGVVRFSKDASINSTSQGRKEQLLAFRANTADDIAKFKAIVDDSMCGELSKAIGREMAYKAVVDTNNRISGRLCGAGATKEDGFVIPNEVIIFKKDEVSENTDGAYQIGADALAYAMMKANANIDERWSAKALAKAVCGYLIQSRPYGVKAAGLVINNYKAGMILRGQKIYKLNIDNMTEEEQEAVDTMLNKALRKEHGVKLDDPNTYPDLFKKDGYTAVRVIRDEKAPKDGIIANLNAHKNYIDLKMIDGLNVLNVAHFEDQTGEYRKTYTAGQFLKIFEMAMEKGDKDVKINGSDALNRIIRRNIDDAIALKPGSIEGLGRDMIDCSYPAGIISALNPSLDGLQYVPGIYRTIVSDTAKRLNNMISRDRYAVAGHAGMLTADIGYVLTNGGNRILEANAKYIEVYDPVWEKYAKDRGMADANRGIGIKYPAMGSFEFLKIRFVTLDEIENRIADLVESEGLDERDASEIFDAYKTFKYGGIMIPAYLDEIAKIAAGLDLDGDKLCVMFEDIDAEGRRYDLVDAIWESGINWRAVDIIPPKDETDKTMVYGIDAYAKMMRLNITFGNKGVGVVTNAMSVFSNAYANSAELDDTAKRFYTELFEEAFVKSRRARAWKKAKSGNYDEVDHLENLSMGTKDYESQLVVEKVSSGAWEGLEVYRTAENIVDRIEDAIYEMAMTWENILKALSDLDVLGRHLQELTIDAQKKFYIVSCDFISRMNTFTLSNKREWVEIIPDFKDGGIGFDMKIAKGLSDFEGGYYVDDDGCLCYGEKASAVNASDKPVTILADAFIESRVAAFNYAADKVREMVADYIEMRASDDRPFDALAADIAASIDGPVRGEIGFYATLIRTARSMYRNKERAIIEDINDPYDDLEDSDINLDVRRLMRSEYDFVCTAISNELRKIGKKYNLNPIKLYGLVIDQLGQTSSGSAATGSLSIMKEESVLWALQYAETKTYEKVVTDFDEETMDAIDETIIVLGNKMILVDGEAEMADGSFVRFGNVMDGEWNVTIDEENNVVISRPIADFIAIPDADETQQIVQYDLGANPDLYNKLLAHVNKSVELKVAKDEDGHDALRMLNSETNEVYDGKAWGGSFARTNYIDGKPQFKVMANNLAGTGIVDNVVSSVADGKDGNKYNYALLTMRNFVPTAASENEVVVEKEAMKFNSFEADTFDNFLTLFK